MRNLTKLFKSLGDNTNLRILNLLFFSDQELCVRELVDTLLERQYNVSKHLAELLRLDLIRSRKEGRWVYYRLHNDRVLKQLMEMVKSEIKTLVLAQDVNRLGKRLKLRQNGKCLIGIQNKNLFSKE